MSLRPTVSNRVVQRIVDTAAAAGVDRRTLCAAAGIEYEAVQSPDARTDSSAYLHLWIEATARTGDPAFPLRVAATYADLHDVLRFVCMTSPDLAEAYRRCCQYLPLVTSGVSWAFHRLKEGGAVAVERRGPPHPGHTPSDEFFAARIVDVGRRLTGVEFRPERICFRHPAPADTRAFRSFFQCPLRYGCARTEVVVDAATLALPLVQSDPQLSEFFERHANELLARLPAETSLARKVQEAIEGRLTGGDVSAAAVASAFAISARTLRRRLNAEGASFEQLLDEARFGRARSHLEGRDLPISEISFLLGFSEPSAFHRAFRRWSGTTPQEWRRRAPGG